MYRPAEFVTLFGGRRSGCFKRARPLNLGSDGATGSFNTTLEYRRVGSNHSESAAAQINERAPDPPAASC